MLHGREPQALILLADMAKDLAPCCASPQACEEWERLVQLGMVEADRAGLLGHAVAVLTEAGEAWRDLRQAEESWVGGVLGWVQAGSPDVQRAKQRWKRAVLGLRRLAGVIGAHSQRLAGAARTDDGLRPSGGVSLDWRTVQRRLLESYERGEPYTSIGDLANRLGCGNATVQKAIKPPQSSLDRLNESARAEASSAARKLAGWQARTTKAKGAPRATSINGVVTDNAEQTREADPAKEAESDDVEIVFNRLIQEAQPEERAQLNEMDADQRRRMVAVLRNDPDNYDRILGRKP